MSQLIILEQNQAAEASPHLPVHAPAGSARCFERSIMPGRSPARLRPKPPTKPTLRQLPPRRSGRLLPRQNLRLPQRDRTADDVRVPARQPVRVRVGVVRVAASPGCRQACRARRCRAPGWGSSALGSRANADLGGGLAASACQPSSSCAATTTHQHLPRASTATYPTFMSCLHSWSWRRVDQHQLGDGVSDFFSVENSISTRRTWNVLVYLWVNNSRQNHHAYHKNIVSIYIYI